jgi:hypothetical protein
VRQVFTLLVAAFDPERKFTHRLFVFDAREDAEKLAEVIRETFEADESGSELLAIEVEEKTSTPSIELHNP